MPQLDQVTPQLKLWGKMMILFLSFLVSYTIQNIHVSYLDLHYLWIMSIMEIVVIFTLFMIFVVNSHFVVPVVRALVRICELCFQGIMGQVMYVLDILLLFHGFLYLFSMLDSCGFTFENFMNFFAAPPASFQLGCLFLLSETTIVLLGVFLVKAFPDLVYASIDRSRVVAVGMNPSGLQILQKAAQIGGLAVGGALIANTLNSAVNAYTADNALNSNREIFGQVNNALERGKIDASKYADIACSTVQSNAAIAKKSSTFAFKN